jgi:hypothetical protein
MAKATDLQAILQCYLPRYHHPMFTLPEVLNVWIEVHPQTHYSQLFQSVWEALRAFGEDPKRLGGQVGTFPVRTANDRCEWWCNWCRSGSVGMADDDALA